MILINYLFMPIGLRPVIYIFALGVHHVWIFVRRWGISMCVIRVVEHNCTHLVANLLILGFLDLSVRNAHMNIRRMRLSLCVIMVVTHTSVLVGANFK